MSIMRSSKVIHGRKMSPWERKKHQAAALKKKKDQIIRLQADHLIIDHNRTKASYVSQSKSNHSKKSYQHGSRSTRHNNASKAGVDSEASSRPNKHSRTNNTNDSFENKDFRGEGSQKRSFISNHFQGLAENHDVLQEFEERTQTGRIQFIHSPVKKRKNAKKINKSTLRQSKKGIKTGKENHEKDMDSNHPGTITTDNEGTPANETDPEFFNEHDFNKIRFERYKEPNYILTDSRDHSASHQNNEEKLYQESQQGKFKKNKRKKKHGKSRKQIIYQSMDPYRLDSERSQPESKARNPTEEPNKDQSRGMHHSEIVNGRKMQSVETLSSFAKDDAEEDQSGLTPQNVSNSQNLNNYEFNFGKRPEPSRDHLGDSNDDPSKFIETRDVNSDDLKSEIEESERGDPPQRYQHHELDIDQLGDLCYETHDGFHNIDDSRGMDDRNPDNDLYNTLGSGKGINGEKINVVSALTSNVDMSHEDHYGEGSEDIREGDFIHLNRQRGIDSNFKNSSRKNSRYSDTDNSRYYRSGASKGVETGRGSSSKRSDAYFGGQKSKKLNPILKGDSELSNKYNGFDRRGEDYRDQYLRQDPQNDHQRDQDFGNHAQNGRQRRMEMNSYAQEKNHCFEEPLSQNTADIDQYSSAARTDTPSLVVTDGIRCRNPLGYSIEANLQQMASEQKASREARNAAAQEVETKDPDLDAAEERNFKKVQSQKMVFGGKKSGVKKEKGVKKKSKKCIKLNTNNKQKAKANFSKKFSEAEEEYDEPVKNIEITEAPSIVDQEIETGESQAKPRHQKIENMKDYSELVKKIRSEYEGEIETLRGKLEDLAAIHNSREEAHQKELEIYKEENESLMQTIKVLRKKLEFMKEESKVYSLSPMRDKKKLRTLNDSRYIKRLSRQTKTGESLQQSLLFQTLNSKCNQQQDIIFEDLEEHGKYSSRAKSNEPPKMTQSLENKPSNEKEEDIKNEVATFKNASPVGSEAASKTTSNPKEKKSLVVSQAETQTQRTRQNQDIKSSNKSSEGDKSVIIEIDEGETCIDFSSVYFEMEKPQKFKYRKAKRSRAKNQDKTQIEPEEDIIPAYRLNIDRMQYEYFFNEYYQDYLAVKREAVKLGYHILKKGDITIKHYSNGLEKIIFANGLQREVSCPQKGTINDFC